jgi:hypothetical protein
VIRIEKIRSSNVGENRQPQQKGLSNRITTKYCIIKVQRNHNAIKKLTTMATTASNGHDDADYMIVQDTMIAKHGRILRPPQFTIVSNIYAVKQRSDPRIYWYLHSSCGYLLNAVTFTFGVGRRTFSMRY